MKRVLFLLVAAVIAVPGNLLGQDVNAGTPSPSGLPSLPSISRDSEGNGMLSGLPGISGIKIGKVLVNPYARIGYQFNGVNMSIPINAEFDPFPNVPEAHLALGTLDVALKSFNFWTGAVGLNVILSPTLTVFGSASGFLPHSFTEVGKLPISLGPLGFVPQISYTGINLECWTMQCGVSAGFGSGYSLLLGSLWQYTSMNCEDKNINSAPHNPTSRQDFLLKNWAPYIGFQYMQTGYYRAAFVYSPLLTSSGAISCRTTTPVLSDLSYNLNQPGYLLSITGEYFLPLPPPATVSFWFTGAISSIKGSTDISFVSGNISRNGVGSDLSLNQYSLGGGMTLGLVF